MVVDSPLITFYDRFYRFPNRLTSIILIWESFIHVLHNTRKKRRISSSGTERLYHTPSHRNHFEGASRAIRLPKLIASKKLLALQCLLSRPKTGHGACRASLRMPKEKSVRLDHLMTTSWFEKFDLGKTRSYSALKLPYPNGKIIGSERVQAVYWL